MRRITGVLACVLLSAAALSGCSSSGGDDKAVDPGGTSVPSAPGASDPAPASTSATPATSDTASTGASTGTTHGRVDYTGSVSGGFDVTTSVGCTTHSGQLLSATASDEGDDSATPSFSVNLGHAGTAVLITPDSHIFVSLGAHGLSAEKQGGGWTVTASGVALEAGDGSSGHVTVMAHLTCTKVSGVGAS